MVDNKQNVPVFKIVMLGEGEVGKTSLLIRYLQNKFNEHLERTVPQFGNNVSYLEKRLELRQYGQEIQLNLWDTAGQERFAAIAPIYYKNADAAIVVYNVSVRESSEKVEKWIQEIKSYSDNKSFLITVVGNKCDLIHQMDQEKTGEKIAQQHGCKHFYTSCKTGKGVNEVFQEVGEGLFTLNKNREQRSKRGKLLIASEHNETRNSLQNNQKQDNDKKSGGCC